MSEPLLALAAVLVGAMLWSPSEYVLHRFVMHTASGRGPVAGEHRLHHRDAAATSLPRRMLLHLAVYVSAGLAGLALSLVVPAPLAFGLALGFSGGFACYELLHWRAHHRQPRYAYTRWLRRHHLDHHRHARRAFGVTTPLWDRVFGTA